MVGRLVVFAAWAALGAVASYGAVYAFSFYGIMILAVCLLVGAALPRHWPETLGLAAGPGILLAAAAEPAWIAAGWAIIATTTIAYLLVGRARCARHPSG